MDLNEQLDRDMQREEEGYPDPWFPEDKGERIIGTLTDFRQNVQTNSNYGPSDVAEIDPDPNYTDPSDPRFPDDMEPRGVFLSSKVLRDQWQQADPMLGDTVGIVYLGERQPEGGMPYHNWKVRVDRSDENLQKVQRQKEKQQREQQAAQQQEQAPPGNDKMQIIQTITDKCKELADILKQTDREDRSQGQLIAWYKDKCQVQDLAKAPMENLEWVVRHAENQIETLQEEIPDEPEGPPVDPDEDVFEVPEDMAEDDIPF